MWWVVCLGCCVCGGGGAAYWHFHVQKPERERAAEARRARNAQNPEVSEEQEISVGSRSLLPPTPPFLSPHGGTCHHHRRHHRHHHHHHHRRRRRHRHHHAHCPLTFSLCVSVGLSLSLCIWLCLSSHSPSIARTHRTPSYDSYTPNTRSLSFSSYSPDLLTIPPPHEFFSPE